MYVCVFAYVHICCLTICVYEQFRVASIAGDLIPKKLISLHFIVDKIFGVCFGSLENVLTVLK